MARQQPAFARSCIPLIPASAALRPAGSICAAMLSLNNATASIRIQLHLLLFTARCRTPALKGFVCTALPHRQSTPSSPHSRPAELLASACIRSQMRLSTCLAPHSSPGGLRLCSKCFRPLGHGNRLHPQQVAFCAVSLHPHSAAFAALFCQVPHTSPEGLRLHSIAAPPDARALPAVRIRARL